MSALVPGWQPVAGRDLVAFDVPPTWHVEEGAALTGFEYHDPSDARLVAMHDVASYRTGICPQLAGSARARAGFTTTRGLTATSAAPELSALWAELAGLQLGGREADVSPTQTVATTVAAGTVAAVESTTLVHFRQPLACQAPSMAVTVVSFLAHGAVVAFVLWTDEGVDDAVPSLDATKILRSLRPVS